MIYSDDPSAEQLPPDDAAIVANRTPGFTTWQGNHWMSCCGRACIYLGEADGGDLAGRWADVVPGMFADDDLDEEYVRQTVADIQRGGSPAAYVFQCRTCGKLQGYWDCD